MLELLQPGEKYMLLARNHWLRGESLCQESFGSMGILECFYDVFLIPLELQKDRHFSYVQAILVRDRVPPIIFHFFCFSYFKLQEVAGFVEPNLEGIASPCTLGLN